MKKYIDILFELTKIRITSFVAFTTVFGYIAFAKEFNWGFVKPTIGILLLACGSAIVNHFQERKTDALMSRTKNRPIPSGRISAGNALLLAIVFILLGSVVLQLSAGWVALGLGLLNLVWYNGIYTPLKKVNPLAIIPGSLVGAIPPAVGWVAAGGNVLDPQIIVLSFFFFIWQIPHFWLLLLVLNKDYEQAGFPTLTQIFSTDQLARITFMWILATVVTGLIIPLFGVVRYPFINFSLLAVGLWLSISSLKLLKPKKKNIYFNFAFREINIFAILVVLLISIDKLVISF